MPFQVRVNFLVQVIFLFKLGADLGQVLLVRHPLVSPEAGDGDDRAFVGLAGGYKHTYTTKETNLSSTTCNLGGCASSFTQACTQPRGKHLLCSVQFRRMCLIVQEGFPPLLIMYFFDVNSAQVGLAFAGEDDENSGGTTFLPPADSSPPGLSSSSGGFGGGGGKDPNSWKGWGALAILCTL